MPPRVRAALSGRGGGASGAPRRSARNHGAEAHESPVPLSPVRLDEAAQSLIALQGMGRPKKVPPPAETGCSAGEHGSPARPRRSCSLPRGAFSPLKRRHNAPGEAADAGRKRLASLQSTESPTAPTARPTTRSRTSTPPDDDFSMSPTVGVGSTAQPQGGGVVSSTAGGRSAGRSNQVRTSFVPWLVWFRLGCSGVGGDESLRIGMG